MNFLKKKIILPYKIWYDLKLQKCGRSNLTCVNIISRMKITKPPNHYPNPDKK